MWSNGQTVIDGTHAPERCRGQADVVSASEVLESLQGKIFLICQMIIALTSLPLRHPHGTPTQGEGGQRLAAAVQGLGFKGKGGFRV